MLKNEIRDFIFPVLLLVLCGCVGIGAPILSPELNAKNAEALINHGRPLPAESLIEVTIERSKKKNDEIGLAIAYGAYAGFLQSRTVTEWREYYEKNGFIDSSVNFENRNEKAREYWQKALDLYIKNAEYARASNVYINLASLDFFEFENKQAACQDIALSLQYHNQFKETHPGETVVLPEGIATFDDFIEAAKKQLECE